jgi:hypothetical protein
MVPRVKKFEKQCSRVNIIACVCKHSLQYFLYYAVIEHIHKNEHNFTLEDLFSKLCEKG